MILVNRIKTYIKSKFSRCYLCSSLFFKKFRGKSSFCSKKCKNTFTTIYKIINPNQNKPLAEDTCYICNSTLLKDEKYYNNTKRYYLCKIHADLAMEFDKNDTITKA